MLTRHRTFSFGFSVAIEEEARHNCTYILFEIRFIMAFTVALGGSVGPRPAGRALARNGTQLVVEADASLMMTLRRMNRPRGGANFTIYDLRTVSDQPWTWRNLPLTGVRCAIEATGNRSR